MEAGGPHLECCCTKAINATLRGIESGTLYWTTYALTTTLLSPEKTSKIQLSVNVSGLKYFRQRF